MRPLIFIFCIVLLSSCNNKENGKELVRQYISDSIFTNKKIYDIYISPLDSLYSSVFETQQYIQTKHELIEYRRKIEKEKSDYNYEKSIGGTGINKKLIVLYQNSIREGIKRLNELQMTYKPKYLGFKCSFHAKYQTDFTDSILVGYCYLSPKKDRFLVKPIYESGYAIDSTIGNLMDAMFFYDEQFIQLEMDTTKLFIKGF
ncbi:hypothetical protein [Bacteroides cellulosilyticus]|nr:hypothetical protein [Bacteroides cellulosilyticus]MBN9710446.1 hypothetical protein [Bacteroides cellulosilyticus]MDC7305431.1 hypothetical protein [Bacteroides cellulosilyticus DSM 14838]